MVDSSNQDLIFLGDPEVTDNFLVSFVIFIETNKQGDEKEFIFLDFFSFFCLY